MFSRCALPIAVVFVLCGSARSEVLEPSGGRYALGEVLGETSGSFQRALAPRRFEFPRDHGPHPDFRSEWWYLTANLVAKSGARYGAQCTIFRQSLGVTTSGTSRWRAQSAWMVHAAITDVGAQMHRSRQVVARGALSLAGAAVQEGTTRVWTADQHLTIGTDPLEVANGLKGSWVSQSRASNPPHPKTWVSCIAPGSDFGIELNASSPREPVPNGVLGLSRKGPEPGNASYYYSMPFLGVAGVLTLDGQTVDVAGHAWLDREWSTSVLSPDHVGWDWLALRLSSGRALMAYRIRRRDGRPSGFDYGAWYSPQGSSRTVALRRMTPVRWWNSENGTRWPVTWRIELGDRTTLVVSAAVDDQLMRHSIRYWEGVVDVSGTDDAGRKVTGEGYLEMTGYGNAD